MHVHHITLARLGCPPAFLRVVLHLADGGGHALIVRRRPRDGLMYKGLDSIGVLDRRSRRPCSPRCTIKPQAFGERPDDHAALVTRLLIEEGPGVLERCDLALDFQDAARHGRNIPVAFRMQALHGLSNQFSPGVPHQGVRPLPYRGRTAFLVLRFAGRTERGKVEIKAFQKE